MTLNLPAVLRNLADHPEAFFEDGSCAEYLRQAAQALAQPEDAEPLVTALIQAVKMERDEFNERCDESYSTEALLLAKRRVSLCKAAVLSAMRSGSTNPPKAASIAPEQGRVVPAHTFDDDSVCVRCGFDGAEWWHLERTKPFSERQPEPGCESAK